MSLPRLRYLVLGLCLLAADAWLALPRIPVHQDIEPARADHRRPPFADAPRLFAEHALRDIVARLLG